MNKVHDVDIVGAKLVEEAQALDILAAVVGHGLSEALAHKHIGAKAGRERIVAAIILGWLFGPEVVTKHRIEVKAALQRLKAPIVFHIYRPRYIVLLQCHGNLGVVAIIFWNDAKEQMRFPLPMLAIVPTNAHRHKAHIATKLHYMLSGDKGIPVAAVAVYAMVVTGDGHGAVDGIDGFFYVYGVGNGRLSQTGHQHTPYNKQNLGGGNGDGNRFKN